MHGISPTIGFRVRIAGWICKIAVSKRYRRRVIKMIVFDPSPPDMDTLTDRSTPINLMRVGINPRLALSSRVALPSVRTPDSNEILSENPLVEGMHSGIVSYKSARRSRNTGALTLESSIAGLTLQRISRANPR
jgi:hypothetical protein